MASFGLSLLALAETLRICLPTVVEAQLGRDVTRETCSARLAVWAQRLMREADIEVVIRGLDHLLEERRPLADGDSRVSAVDAAPRTFVVMSNHQSLYDVPMMYATFPHTLRMVAKTELFKIPIFSGAIKVAEMIEMDRGNRDRARASIKEAQQRLRSGINVWIAPEGTRSETGALGTFKKGGFILALETGARILPVTIDGANKVLRAHGRRVHRHQRVVVTYHRPIDPMDYGVDRREELVKAVRDAIQSGFGQSGFAR